MQFILDDVIDVWGIKVECVEIKDVKLFVQFQRVMVVEVEVFCEVCVKVIVVEGEMNVFRVLKEVFMVIIEFFVVFQF